MTETYGVKGTPTVFKLTKDIDCPWCGAKAGEPCKIQLTTEELYRPGTRNHPQDYHLGNNKIYYPQGEQIHYGRTIEVPNPNPEGKYEDKD